MTQLVNDCFSLPSEMISAAEALAQIDQAVTRVSDPETCSLSNAENRILAADIHSPRNIPPADNAAVDGYAFSFADYQANPERARVVAGRSAAGRPFLGNSPSDSVVKILTGAVMPEGLDSVAMIEDIRIDGEKIVLPRGLKQGANRRRAGEDIRNGQLLLAMGTYLRPQEIGYLASIGTVSVPVYRQLRVALFSTGDELVNPGDPAFPGSIHDSNRFILAGLFRSFGCLVTDLGILGDEKDIVRLALHSVATDHDLVITSGGVSMGDEDHVKAALEEIGHLNFWRIAIKPGRPLALGQINSTAFVGLPGNPIAAMVCCLKFVRPLILKLSGRNDGPPLTFQAAANFAMTKKPGRTEWLRAKYSATPDSIGSVEKFPTEGSGILSSAVWANGLIELGDEVAQIKEGDLVTFLPFSELMR